MPVITDGDITTGFIRRERRIIKRLLGIISGGGEEGEYIEVRMPKAAYEYAKKVSELTGKPLDEVIFSSAVRKYVDRFKEEVTVRIRRR